MYHEHHVNIISTCFSCDPNITNIAYIAIPAAPIKMNQSRTTRDPYHIWMCRWWRKAVGLHTQTHTYGRDDDEEEDDVDAIFNSVDLYEDHPVQSRSLHLCVCVCVCVWLPKWGLCRKWGQCSWSSHLQWVVWGLRLGWFNLVKLKLGFWLRLGWGSGSG